MTASLDNGGNGRAGATARLLTVGFALLVGAVPIAEVAADLAAGRRPFVTTVVSAPLTAEGLTSFERAFERASSVGKLVRRPTQWLLSRCLRRGNEKVVLGRDGWLYYRPSLDHVNAPPVTSGDEPGTPRRAIRDFRDALAERGIALVVMPVPGKEAVQPEHLWWSSRTPTENDGLAGLYAALATDGVQVYDPAPILREMAAVGDAFLPGDTHWTPAAMDAVAARLASMLVSSGQMASAGVRLRPEPPTEVTNRGDLYDMLDLPSRIPLLAATSVLTEPVRGGVRRGAESRVLLLGDSFTNVYSDPALRWGRDAGLGERLAYHLGEPVDLIALNDGGVNGSRTRLAREPGRLVGKQVVIWQFATRDLTNKAGEWQSIPLRTAGEAVARSE